MAGRPPLPIRDLHDLVLAAATDQDRDPEEVLELTAP
jgi:hypothetical protein